MNRLTVEEKEASNMLLIFIGICWLLGFNALILTFSTILWYIYNNNNIYTHNMVLLLSISYKNFRKYMAVCKEAITAFIESYKIKTGELIIHKENILKNVENNETISNMDDVSINENTNIANALNYKDD